MHRGHRDVLAVPFADLLDMVTYWLFENLDEKERAKLENDLMLPFEGQDISDDVVWSAEAELASWPSWTG